MYRLMTFHNGRVKTVSFHSFHLVAHFMAIWYELTTCRMHWVDGE
jgi:hypothetical protein